MSESILVLITHDSSRITYQAKDAKYRFSTLSE